MNLKMYKKLPIYRYKKTLKMLKEVCPEPTVIFDLGVRNPFSEIMRQNNYKVYNTSGEDLDDHPNIEIPGDVELVTGFEILEHLVSPYPLLKNIKANRIFLTVPIKLWFSKAYKKKQIKPYRGTPIFIIWNGIEKNEIGRIIGYRGKDNFYRNLKDQLNIFINNL